MGRYRRGAQIHPITSSKLEFLLRLLAEKGEDEAFKYIRTHKVIDLYEEKAPEN